MSSGILALAPMPVLVAVERVLRLMPVLSWRLRVKVYGEVLRRHVPEAPASDPKVGI